MAGPRGHGPPRAPGSSPFSRQKHPAMLCDSLDCLGRYLGLHPALDTAIRWLETNDLAALPNGRTEVDGSTVYINVMDAGLRPAEGADFEYHHLYADLQIDLAGCEYWAWTAQAQPTVPFGPAADCGFVAGPEQSSGLLGEGRFALFLPGEYHKPSCISPVSTAVRKAVVKIRMGG